MTDENPYAKYAKVTADMYTPMRGWMQNVVIFSTSVYARFMYGLTVEGQERIPRDIGPYIVAANHMSNMDPPLISWSMGYQVHVAYMAKKELYETPVGKLFCWAMGTFAVNRQKLEMATIRSCKEVLKAKDWHLGIFPEGTRNKDASGVAETKRGVGFIATMNKKPVLPIGIARYMKDGKVRMHIRVGELIPYHEGLDTDTMSQQVVDALNELVALKPGWEPYQPKAKNH